MKMHFLSIALISIMLFACRNDDVINEITEQTEKETQLTEGGIDIPDWTDATHSKGVSPNYDVVFNQQKVLRLDITINTSDWTAMQTDLSTLLGASGGMPPVPGGMRGPGGPGAGGVPADIPTDATEDPIWVPCSFYFEGKQWYKVGIRYKGNSSLRSAYQSGNSKLSFKLDFDEFEDDYPELKNQRFYGFKQLNLNNNFNDASFMREKVASDLFREFGLISAQTTFCEVYIDNGSGAKYFGLYTLVEEMDDTVIKTQTGDDAGNLYKPDGTAASFASGSYDDSQMEKKNNEDQADYTDVKALYDAINNDTRTSNPTLWKQDLENVFNVDGFLKWLAANTVIQNWDTYGRMTHNYYLYNHPTNKLTWIPWDNNEALQEGKQGGALSLSMTDVDNNWPLIRHLIDDADYKQVYEAYLLQFVEQVFKPSEMSALYSTYYERIKTYAYAEEIGYTYIRSASEFDQAVETLKTHVQNRNDAVKQ